MTYVDQAKFATIYLVSASISVGALFGIYELVRGLM